jgi:hypothetical protein
VATLAVLAALAVTVIGVTGLTAPASAAPQAAATAPPSSTPTPTPVTLDKLPSNLVTSFPLRVSGSGTPDDVISVSGGSTPGPAESCSDTVGPDGRWTCSVAVLPDGGGVPVRAESRDSTTAASGLVDVLGPPAIEGDGVVATTGAVRGTAFPNATVTAAAETGASCTFTADSAGRWGCVLTGSLSDGRHTVTATQVAGFSTERSRASGGVAIDVDRTAPPAPSITTPRGGSSARAGAAMTIGGSGEAGAHVTVYASTSQGTTVVCTADVAGTSWSCQGALPRGGYLLSALQRDDAGNVSAGSNSIAMNIEGASAPAPSRTPQPTPTPAAPAPAIPVPGPPSGTVHPDTKGWIGTPFTLASAPVVSAAAVPGWVRSAGLAIAALLLLVLPLRLLAAALSRNRSARGDRRRRASVFGRNQPRAAVAETSALFDSAHGAHVSTRPPAGSAVAASEGHAPTSSGGQPRWRAPLAGVAAAALVTLSSPVDDAAAYVRLLLAVLAALAAVNAVWVLSARGIAPHLRLAVPRVLTHPGLLAVVAVTAIGSRILGLSPALLFGLVLGVALGPHAGRVRRGRIAAVQVSAVAALGVIAWLTVGLLAAPTGAFSAFLIEFANAVALVGIGSSAIALLPVAGLAGRSIAQWSRWLWAGLTLVVYTVLFALLLPVASLVETGAGTALIMLAAFAFAAFSVSVWLWERYVAPALDRTAA